LIKPVSRALLARDALRADEFGGLSFGPGARPILKGEADVQVVLPPKRERRRKSREDYPHDPLFDRLREVRRALAQARGVPPYVIFHDSTLREMASSRPCDRHELARISGVGSRKLDDYGDAFLEAIRTAS
jgi:ATP-dependent DNA helicase RecQ